MTLAKKINTGYGEVHELSKTTVVDYTVVINDELTLHGETELLYSEQDSIQDFEMMVKDMIEKEIWKSSCTTLKTAKEFEKYMKRIKRLFK